MAQQTPEGSGMPLYSVCPADNQNGVVQHLQGALHFCGKIHMSRRIQKRDISQSGLFGKNRYSPGTLLLVRIQKSVLMVHPAQISDLPGHIEHCLR